MTITLECRVLWCPSVQDAARMRTPHARNWKIHKPSTTASFYRPLVGFNYTRPQMSRLGGVRGFSVRLDAELTLQLRGQAVHEPRPDHRMPLKLDGQSFQEGVALERMDRRGGRLDGGEFGIAEAERHGWHDDVKRAATSRGKWFEGRSTSTGKPTHQERAILIRWSNNPDGPHQPIWRLPLSSGRAIRGVSY